MTPWLNVRADVAQWAEFTKFADTIERTYSTCSWMPDDRFQDAISAAVDEFLGTAPKVDIY